jgi:hypothetical protein
MPTGRTESKMIAAEVRSTIGIVTLAFLSLILLSQHSNADTSSKLPYITSPVKASITIGAPFKYQITATQNPTVFGAKNLPIELTLDPTTGWMSGKFAIAGLIDITLTATNLFGTSTMDLVITVIPAVPEVAYNGSAWNVPGKIEAENFDLGGEGVAFHDVDAANISGLYRNEGVDIGECKGEYGGYDVGWTIPGEWLNYSINVANGGLHTVSLRVAIGNYTKQTVHFEIDHANVTGPLAIPDTGGWTKWRTITSSAFQLTPGPHILTLYFESADLNVNWIKVQ